MMSRHGASMSSTPSATNIPARDGAVPVVVLVSGLPVAAELPPESLEAIAAALAERMPTPRPQGSSPYLSPDEAAELLRCNRRRVYDLVADGRLTRHGDGRRLLVARAEVENLANGRG